MNGSKDAEENRPLRRNGPGVPGSKAEVSGTSKESSEPPSSSPSVKAKGSSIISFGRHNGATRRNIRNAPDPFAFMASMGKKRLEP